MPNRRVLTGDARATARCGWTLKRAQKPFSGLPFRANRSSPQRRVSRISRGNLVPLPFTATERIFNFQAREATS